MLRTPSLIAKCVFAASLVLACSDDASDAPEPVTFAADIHPILMDKCGDSGCHATDIEGFQPGHGAADVDDAYAATQAMARDQPVYERILIRTDSPDAMMPPSFANPPCEGALDAPGCLTTAEHDLIQEWVDQGALP